MFIRETICSEAKKKVVHLQNKGKCGDKIKKKIDLFITN